MNLPQSQTTILDLYIYLIVENKRKTYYYNLFNKLYTILWYKKINTLTSK